MPNPIIWTLEWALVGWLLGILLLFVGGLFALPFGVEPRNKVANYYSKLAVKLADRVALTDRGVKFDIYRTEHDGEKNADKATIAGEEGHISNSTGALSTLHKQPFGLIPPPEDNTATYVRPETAEFGEIELRRKEQNELRDDDGNYVEEVTLSATRPLVRIREYASAMIAEERELWDLDETVELYKQSQRLFGESKTTQFMVLIVAYGVGSLLMWLVLTNAGGAAPSTVPVPPLGGG